MGALHLGRRPAASRAEAAHPDLDGDEPTRVRLAARACTHPSVLHALANDPSITVRAAVAMNPVMAQAADRRLVADADERIRMLLAGKIVTLLPGLSRASQAEAHDHLTGILTRLAEDAAVKVRIAISDALGAVPDAPRDVILKLANDPVVAVSGPILRLSPLLTEADLLELLATPPHDSAMDAVAGRLGLSAAVADHIAEHADNVAIRTLLANRTAAIQESTLDALIGRAADCPDWHEPLARRPVLPTRSIRALARIVAANVLDVLMARPDLPPGIAGMLADRIDAALDDTPPQQPTEAEILDGVRRLNTAGQLDEDALMDAMAEGDRRQAAAILAVASGVTLITLDRAVALRSAKALVSLVWKAGFSPHAALAVQSMLGQLAPDEVIATSASGFPLSAVEMDWQIELLMEPGR